MTKLRYLYAFGLVFGFSVLSAKTQVRSRQTGNADTVIYFTYFPYDNSMEIIRTIAGIIIPGYSPSFSPDDAVNIHTITNVTNSFYFPDKLFAFILKQQQDHRQPTFI